MASKMTIIETKTINDKVFGLPQRLTPEQADKAVSSTQRIENNKTYADTVLK